MSGTDALARVGLGATALLTPLTGVGQYVLHLAHELQSLLPEPPWLFYGGHWSREVREADTAVAPGAATRLRRAIPGTYTIARAIQQQRFSAGARAHGLALYHEPNYLAFRFDGPTVVTVHDLSWIRHPETHPADRVRIMNSALPRVLERARHVIVDSEFTRAEVGSHYGVPRARLSVVPLGVSQAFRPLTTQECAPALAARGLEYGSYVLALGTLEPRKNLAAVLTAYARLDAGTRRRHPLAVAGMEGWKMDQLAAPLRELVQGGDVRLLGYVPQAELPALYSGARLFVYPSLYEGFGLPPLEAMACGTPVIVSNRSSLPEVVGDAGEAVDPLDGDELLARLQALLEDDALRARHSAAGVARARAFTWRRCAELTIEAYRKALA
jgi:alpha-1,3-rhamnosyl/mannosyltransferase